MADHTIYGVPIRLLGDHTYADAIKAVTAMPRAKRRHGYDAVNALTELGIAERAGTELVDHGRPNPATTN